MQCQSAGLTVPPDSENEIESPHPERTNTNRMSAQTAPVSTSSLLQENRTFPPSPDVVKRAYINAEQYQQMYDRSIKDPDGFWLEQAKALTWFKKPTKGREYTWDTKGRKIEHTWFEDGQLNVSRQLPGPPPRRQGRPGRP